MTFARDPCLVCGGPIERPPVGRPPLMHQECRESVETCSGCGRPLEGNSKYKQCLRCRQNKRRGDRERYKVRKRHPHTESYTCIVPMEEVMPGTLRAVPGHAEGWWELI